MITALENRLEIKLLDACFCTSW